MAEQQLPEIFAFITICHVRLSFWAPYVPSVIPRDQEDTRETVSEEMFPDFHSDRLRHIGRQLQQQLQQPLFDQTHYRLSVYPDQANRRLVVTGQSFSTTNLARLGAVSHAWLRATLRLTFDPVGNGGLFDGTFQHLLAHLASPRQHT